MAVTMIARHSNAVPASPITNSVFPSEFLEPKRVAQSRPFSFIDSISKNHPCRRLPLNVDEPTPLSGVPFSARKKSSHRVFACGKNANKRY